MVREQCSDYWKMHFWNFPSLLGMIWSLVLPCKTTPDTFAQTRLSSQEKVFFKKKSAHTLGGGGDTMSKQENFSSFKCLFLLPLFFAKKTIKSKSVSLKIFSHVLAGSPLIWKHSKPWHSCSFRYWKYSKRYILLYQSWKWIQINVLTTGECACAQGQKYSATHRRDEVP